MTSSDAFAAPAGVVYFAWDCVCVGQLILVDLDNPTAFILLYFMLCIAKHKDEETIESIPKGRRFRHSILYDTIQYDTVENVLPPVKNSVGAIRMREFSRTTVQSQQQRRRRIRSSLLLPWPWLLFFWVFGDSSNSGGNDRFATVRIPPNGAFSFVIQPNRCRLQQEVKLLRLPTNGQQLQQSSSLSFSSTHRRHNRRQNPQQQPQLRLGMMIPHDFLTSWNEWATSTTTLLSSASHVPHHLPAVFSVYGDLLRNHPISTKATTAGLLAATGDAIAQFRSSQTTPSTTTGSTSSSSSGNSSSSSSYDVRRGLTFLLFGAMYTGAFQHFWFTYLSSHVADWGHAAGLWGTPLSSLAEAASTTTTTASGTLAGAVQSMKTTPSLLLDDLYSTAPSLADLNSIYVNDEWWSYFDILSQPVRHAPTEAMLAAAKVAINQFVVVPLIYMPLFFGVTGTLGGLDFIQTKARAQSLYIPLLTRNYFFWLPMQFVQFFVLPPEWQIPFVSLASLVWTIVLSSVGGLSAHPAAQSQIIAYEPIEGDAASGFQTDLVTVVLVDAGPVSALEDEVLIGEIRDALVPDDVTEAVKGVWSEAQAGAGGAAIGLLASTAAEGSIGAAVGRLVNVEVDVGVALVTAVSAGVGMLAVASFSNDTSTTSDETISEEETVMDLKDETATTATSFVHSQNGEDGDGHIIAVEFNSIKDDLDTSDDDDNNNNHSNMGMAAHHHDRIGQSVEVIHGEHKNSEVMQQRPEAEQEADRFAMVLPTTV